MPTPGLGEVLLKIDAVTTCPHWDMHMMSGEPMFPGARVDYPLTPGQPGHEIVGDVVEVGPGVDDLHVGARVAAWRDRGGDVRLGGYAQYVPFAADSLLQVSTDLAPQFDQALANILAILAEAGGEPEHICRMTAFCIDKPAYLAARPQLGPIWKRRMGNHFPAMSMIFVADLLDRPGLIELEATAVLPAA